MYLIISAVWKLVSIHGTDSPNLHLYKSATFFVLDGSPPNINLAWLIKSNLADRSVKNSGLKTNCKLLNCCCNFSVVPGVTVERIKVIGFQVHTSLISFSARSNIPRCILPS